jgi:cytochrome c peroxidase
MSPFSTRRRGRISVRAGVALVAVGLLAAAGFARRARPADRVSGAMIAQRVIDRDLDSLDGALDALARALANSDDPDPKMGAARVALRGARMRYKRLEGVVEFYSPALAAALNSRRQEVDDEDAPPPSVVGARGFPVLEDVIFAPSSHGDPERAVGTVRAMHGTVRTLRNAIRELRVTDAQLVEIGRQEIARVSTLGIAGFDAPRSGMAMVECADALDGLREFYDSVGHVQWPRLARERSKLDSTLGAAAADLRANSDFETFDRLGFLVAYAQPAARAVDDLRRATGTQSVLMRRPWRAEIASVYDADAFDPGVYAPSAAPTPSPELIALGERLFADVRLSGPGTRSCASCHPPAREFVDGLPRAPTIDPRGSPVARNTPTLLNASLAPAQFSDERSVTLEDQVGEVLRSPSEMGSSIDRAAAVLGRVPEYREAFARAFRLSPDSAVSSRRIEFAIAAYVRSLVALDSRFDRAVRGDTSQVSAEERRGFSVFMGKAGCGTCHFAPLFSGNTPPLFLNSDVEVIGTPSSPDTPRTLDPDSGRARIDHLPNHVRAFKTPSLRNVALTAPYMHNGTFATLEQVIDFYDHGGGRGAGAAIDDQTLAADSLNLTMAEKRALIAFLGTLTDVHSHEASTPSPAHGRDCTPGSRSTGCRAKPE